MADDDPSRDATLPGAVSTPPSASTASTAATLLPDPEATQPGSRGRDALVAGRYQLGDRLGEGGMGVVWEATDIRLSRKVALKILHRGVDDANAAERMRREAELLARVEHANVVAVLDFGEVAPGQPFVVMERVRGTPLSTMIVQGGAMGWPQAVDLAAQICAGLAAAHDLGIIHRDLKASNVLVTRDAHGRACAKVIDFGLAKATAVADRARVPTRSGEVFGTPAYMPPEQVRGDPLDARADIYALGVLLFEMLAGVRPWQHATIVEMLYAQLYAPAPLLRSLVPDAPAELEGIVDRCLCKLPGGRPPDVHALRGELRGVGTRGGTAVAIPLPSSQPIRLAAVPSSRTPQSGRPALWIAGGVLAAMGGAAAVVIAMRPSAAPARVEVESPVAVDEVPVAAPPAVQGVVAPPATGAAAARGAPAMQAPPVGEAPPVAVPPPVADAPPVAVAPATGPAPARNPRPTPQPRPTEPTEPPTAPPPSEPASEPTKPAVPKIGKHGTFDEPFE